MKAEVMSRLNIRLSQEQKEYLKYASRLGGFKSLSDFILTSAISHADHIVGRHEQVLASTKDREMFFAALLRPAKPNAHLKAAAEKYNRQARPGFTFQG